MQKIILEHLDFWSLYVWGSVSAVITIMFLLLKKNIRRNFLLDVKIKKSHYVSIFFNTIFGMSGLISYYIALSLGPATLVSSINAVAPLITLLLTVFCSIFIPHILKEEINRRDLAIKIVAIFLVVVGTIITIL